jgi:hypothetical protein
VLETAVAKLARWLLYAVLLDASHRIATLPRNFTTELDIK